EWQLFAREVLDKFDRLGTRKACLFYQGEQQKTLTMQERLSVKALLVFVPKGAKPSHCTDQLVALGKNRVEFWCIRLDEANDAETEYDFAHTAGPHPHQLGVQHQPANELPIAAENYCKW